jgi:predicted phage terminase large subunit-like protein
MGGTVLGRGADVIIMDDPNNTKRLSAVERKNTIKSWTDTISTRLNNPETGLFIVIQQRLHTEDLSGYLLEKEPQNWTNVCLPAELGQNINPPELAEHYQDGLLWKNRFSRKVLDNFKAVLGSVGYANQLNQLTSPEEGNIIKREWILIEDYDKFLEKCAVNSIKPKWDMFLDSAQTEKKKNDPSGIMVATKIFGNVYVRKAVEKRLTFPDLITTLKTMYKDYKINRLFIEPKSSGKDIVAQLRRQTDMTVVELPSPTTDKETRLNAVSPLIEGERFVLIEDMSNDIIIDQLTQFPNAAHNEFVDLSGYALSKYIKQTSLNYIM